MILRTDSSAACFSLNTLKAKDKSLLFICHRWEDLQYHFGFEGLVLHCSAQYNKLADACSRRDRDDIAGAVLQLAADKGVTVGATREEVEWAGGGVDVDIASELIALAQ